MCKVCSTIKRKQLSQADSLVMIGEAMSKDMKRKSYDHLSELLDRIMDIRENTQDSELNEAWESNRR